MNSFRIGFALLVLATSVSLATADEIPAEANTLRKEISTNLASSVRIWIRAEAVNLCTNPDGNEEDVRAHARKRFDGQQMNEKDMDALVFLVMTEAADILGQRIQEQETRVKTINNARSSGYPPPSKSTGPASTSKGSVYGQAMARAREAGKSTAEQAPQPSPFGGPRQNSGGVSVNTESSLLQQMADRRSKFVSALKETMKKISTKQNDLARNLR